MLSIPFESLLWPSSCSAAHVRSLKWHTECMSAVVRYLTWVLCNFHACYHFLDIVSYYMASSVSGQDESNAALWFATRVGKMELSCPLGTTRRVPQEKFPRKPYNKSFIDQACSVKMAEYWPRSFFFGEFMDLDYASVHKLAKKELGHWSSHLDLILGQ